MLISNINNEFKTINNKYFAVIDIRFQSILKEIYDSYLS